MGIQMATTCIRYLLSMHNTATNNLPSKSSLWHQRLAKIYDSELCDGKIKAELTQTATETSQLQPIPRRNIWCHSGLAALVL